MGKDQIIALAVAMGTPRAEAEANLAAAYPEPQLFDDDVVGTVGLYRDGQLVVTNILRDGSAVAV